MNCFHCGAQLNDSSFCPRCGESIVEYKKIIRTSNAYYNEGLAKAKVRALSGAANCLRRSLKYNKYQTNARNLLGLVYLEMGDGLHALVEWTISCSLQPEQNPAAEYLEKTQGDPVVMDHIRQSIKKYNAAVSYVQGGNDDLAVIQLKKVVELEPKMVAAYQMLALLYMKRSEFGKARKVLAIADKIDSDNTRTRQYILELVRISKGKRSRRERLKSVETNEDRILYKSGNDTIIQPTAYKDNSWVFAFANIAIGIAIGLAAAVFLILPMRVQSVKKEYQQKEQQLYAQLEVTPAPASVSTQSPQPTVLTEATGSPAPTDIPAGTPDPEQTAAPTAGATQEEKDVFGDADLLDVDMSRSAEYYYELAQQNFSYEEYDDSKMFAQQALVIDPEHLESLYYLGRSYQMLEDNERAVKVYEKMVSLYPDSTKWQIQDAKGYLEELQ